jgi:S-adenosyl methyltransferase
VAGGITAPPGIDPTVPSMARMYDCGDSVGKLADHYRKTVAPGSTLRDRDEILRFFTGFELAGPGLVQVPYWRPDEPGSPDAGKVWVLGAVGRKPSEADA